MDTCDWCGKIEMSRITTQQPDFGQVKVCYDCLVEIYESIFPAMKFKDMDLMTRNLLYHRLGMPTKIYTKYLTA